MHTKTIVAFSILAIAAAGISIDASPSSRASEIVSSSNDDKMTLDQRAIKAYQYAKRHRMNTRYAFLVDYSIPSGTPRLFVWDYDKKKVVARTYVMHGIGGGSTKEEPVFSNKPGSMCSSLGRF